MANVNRGRYNVRLSPTEWTKYAEPLPGLRYLGVIERAGQLAALGGDDTGEYFAVFGRRKMPLVKRKVESALNAI
jgi:hypothetical protein